MHCVKDFTLHLQSWGVDDTGRCCLQHTIILPGAYEGQHGPSVFSLLVVSREQGDMVPI